MNFEEQLEALATSQGGELTDAQMAAALTGSLSEGDIAAAEKFAAADNGAPNADATKDQPNGDAGAGAQDDQNKDGKDTDAANADNADPAKGEPGDGDKPKVILAKDGVHTIDYQKLVDARESEKAARAEADRLRAELAAAKAAPAPAPAAAPAAATPAPGPVEVTFGNYDDKDLSAGVNQIVEARLTQAKAEWAESLTPLQAELAASRLEKHLTTIYTAHPDAESVVMSREFEAWKASQPSFMQPEIERIQDKGTAAQMVELLNTYRAANPKAAQAPAPAPAPAAAKGNADDGLTTEQRAERAIANAKTRTPNSLSDLPAGSAAHHDEAGAIAEMDPVDVMNSFHGKTPKQIEELMNRLL